MNWFGIAWWVWAVIGAIVIAVAWRAISDHSARGAARMEADDEAKEDQWIAEGKERLAAWDAWDAEVDRLIAELAENPVQPAFIISLMMGEDYPRYGVFGSEVVTSYRAYRCLGHKRADGVQYPTALPPQTYPNVYEEYVLATERTFDTAKGAEVWLDYFIRLEARQTGFDDELKTLGAFDEFDVEMTVMGGV